MTADNKTADLTSPPLPSSIAARKTSARAEAYGKKGHSYRPLPKEFRRDGFDFRQIARKGDAAVYEQRWTGDPNSSASYEVIRIRRHDGFQIGNRIIGPSEVYPKSEAWGVDGLTFTDKDTAFQKLFAGRTGSETANSNEK
jgi:hypothetical protein